MTQFKDDIYKDSLTEVAGFRFDEPVVNVFKDMISRSVPGYNLILSLLGVISAQYAQDDTQCYDLGCSLGASTLAMRHNIKAKNCRIISIDNSKPMIEKCRQNIINDAANIPVDIHHADINAHPIDNVSIAVLNFTLQFIPIESRSELLKKIATATHKNGVLLLSEKIHFDDIEQEKIIIDLHHQFKRNNGYSDLEVAQKREALENILIPETITAHKERLLDAGYSKVITCLQCFNFVSLLAIK